MLPCICSLMDDIVTQAKHTIVCMQFISVNYLHLTNEAINRPSYFGLEFRSRKSFSTTVNDTVRSTMIDDGL